MTKKLDALAEEKDGRFGKMVVDSATQIWLAGLGAFSKAQEEGTKLFESLVKEGEKAQKHMRGAAGDAVAEMRERAGERWDKLEEVFEDRVSQVLGRLSVPTSRDVEALKDKVDALTAAVEDLGQRTGHGRAHAAHGDDHKEAHEARDRVTGQ